MSKAQNRVKIKWSPDFAYIIGLITTDGSLSKDGRHIIFTSKDKELVLTFKQILNLSNAIGLKASGSTKTKKYSYIQFGDVNFYTFLEKIGLMPNKTLQLKNLKIPSQYFFDFLRGHFDGDGSFYSYWDKRWKSSFMFYTAFISASKPHILWIQHNIQKLLGIKGHITHGRGVSVYQLKYAKKESMILVKKMYYSDDLPCLQRKRLKIFSLFDKIN
jgi:hypothetical protein